MRPPAGPARRRGRHRGLIASFLLLVLLPLAIAGGYLFFRAQDRYASSVGFAVRSARASTTLDILGGFTELGNASTGDAATVYEYLQSQDLVARLDSELDLRGMLSRGHLRDPAFTFDPQGTIEDLVRYWNRMTRVSFDSGTGLIALQVQAFAPADAQRIARAAFRESARMINELSAIAQDDATRSARAELARAEDRLRKARQALESFRSRTRILDPSADVSGRMGLLNSLQDQLVTAMIDLDMLQQTTRPGDPRIDEAKRRIAVIRQRMSDERRIFGVAEAPGAPASDPAGQAGAAGTAGGAEKAEGTESYARLLGDFERLSVDQDFAEKSYVAALASYDSAQEEARQQSLYLAAYEKPTLAQASIYPDRPLLLALTALFLALGWGILALVYYSLRDRR